MKWGFWFVGFNIDLKKGGLWAEEFSQKTKTEEGESQVR